VPFRYHLGRDAQWVAVPIDDPVQAADAALRRHQAIHFDAQSLAAKLQLYWRLLIDAPRSSRIYVEHLHF